MKKIVLILSVILLASCKSEPPRHIEGGEERFEAQRDFGSYEINYLINYFKDTRTGLCFAETGTGREHTLTCVPCTEEVEALIK
jgi:hypothetical protein